MGEGERSGFGFGAETVRRSLRRRFAEPSALRAAFRRARPGEVSENLSSEEMGRAERGRRLIAGWYDFAGVAVQSPSPRALWRAEPPSAPWRAVAHGFEWLADLDALGGARAKSVAQTAADAWLTDRSQAYDALVWREDVAARRLRAFVLFGGLAGPNTASPRRAVWLRALSAHGEWLTRRLDGMAPGSTRLGAAIAVAELSLAAAGWAERRDAAAQALDKALGGALLADGCPLDRNPETLLRLFAALRVLADRYADRSQPAPERLETAIARMALALRMLRAGDGGLPVFHGGGEGDPGALESQLSRIRLPGAPQWDASRPGDDGLTASAPRSLTEGGFERLSGGRVAALVDVGPAPAGIGSETAHASVLALELSAGRRRVIVNSGSAAHLDADWARASRAGPAQSGLTFDGASPARLSGAAPAFGDGRALRLSGPPGVVSERREERNGVWLQARHDGYRAEYGVTVARRLFLSADGGDFRGEDSALVDDGEMTTFQRRLSKLPRADRERGFALTARFHLHPDVAAALVADGEAVTLRLPHGEVWVMRQAGGALSLAPGAYLGRSPKPEETKQIVITVGAARATTQIRWAFRRVGDLNALPKDIDALAKHGEQTAADAQKIVARPPFAG